MSHKTTQQVLIDSVITLGLFLAAIASTLLIHLWNHP